MTSTNDSEYLDQLRAEIQALAPGARIAIAHRPPDHRTVDVAVWLPNQPDTPFRVETDATNIRIDEARTHLVGLFQRWLDNGGSYLSPARDD
jgi:hypothetical protein